MNGKNEKNKQFIAFIFLTLSNGMLCCLERNFVFKNWEGPQKWNSLGPLIV